jgi:hypothetical protein
VREKNKVSVKCHNNLMRRWECGRIGGVEEKRLLEGLMGKGGN